MKRLKQPNVKIKHFIVTAKAVKDLHTFEPSWPEKTDSEYWRTKFEETPYRSFMREYMHVHIQDGEIFKPEQIQYKQMLSLEKYEGLVFYGDLSYKEAGDYKGMGLIGKTGREFHLIFCFLRKTSRKLLAQWLYDLVEDNKLLDHNISYQIEGLFAMDDFVNDFDVEGDERGWYIPVTADKKSKIDKFDRIESMAGYFERLNIFFNEKYRGNNDYQTMEDQLFAFEKGSGANDDGPDFLQSGISKVNQITFVTKFEPKTTTRKELIKNKKNRF